jgi:hypothetical protein
MWNDTREISVFIDESGSFEPTVVSSRFYLVCLVFHNQSADISDAIARLEDALEGLGLPPDYCVHAGPLIRREGDCKNESRERRRAIFAKMLSFIRKADFSYRCFFLDKRFESGEGAVHDALLQKILSFLMENSAEFNAFDRLKIYYDNGQAQVMRLIREAFIPFSSKVEFVDGVTPSKYRLFQVADTICTLELVRLKLEIEHRISDSEFAFFNGIQNLKKNYLKPIERKRHS